MIRPLSMTRAFEACLALLVLTLIAPCAWAASPKRVLILDPFGTDVAPFSAVKSAFRSTLLREMEDPIDIYDLPLELARFAESEGEGPLVAFLEARIKNHPVDLVVCIGAGGVEFAAKHGEHIFADAPVLVLASDPRFIPPDILQTNATLVTQKVNLPGTVEDILQMQPQTTDIAVVFGASALESRWVNECRREFQPFAKRVRFTWLNGLPLPQILERCAALPPNSFILHLLFVVDGDGVPCEENEALRRLHQVANAPLFGYFASEFGLGPIGGRLYQNSDIGTQGARTAVRILRGESPRSIPPQVFEDATPVFDWRELQRWGVSEARLPTGSIIQFRQPSFWERYWMRITGAALFGLLQTALIVGLLVNRARRRQGEEEAILLADISTKFVNLPPGEVDSVIIDAERRICELLDLDLAALWQKSHASAGVLTPTHVYKREGLQRPQQMRWEQFPWYGKEVMHGRVVAVSSLEELPAEATVDRESCRQLGVKSNLTMPLSVGGKPTIGLLGLNTLRKERDWPDALVKRLQVVVQIFANALDRKYSDQALRESEQRFRLLIEQAPEAILLWDVERGGLVLANAEAERLFGCSREELVEAGPQGFYAPVLPNVQPIDQGAISAYAERALSGETVVFERTICNALGRQIDCEVRLTRLPADGRKLIRSSYINITARKEAEAALHDLNGQLIRAHEEERSRLARELHDDVTQRLALLAIDASRAQRSIDGTTASEVLRSICAGLVRLSEDIHSLAYRLHPSLLEDLGLVEAVKAECERFSRQESVIITTNLRDLPASIPSDTAICLFRVAQESIRNVIRHGRAHAIELSLGIVDSRLQLCVQDDGIGFEPTALRGRHSLGLAGMRERLLLVGGELEIESTPGRGTTILAWAPVQKGQL
jgi:PAS domain S-box-containing protein